MTDKTFKYFYIYVDESAQLFTNEPDSYFAFRDSDPLLIKEEENENYSGVEYREIIKEE